MNNRILLDIYLSSFSVPSIYLFVCLAHRWLCILSVDIVIEDMRSVCHLILLISINVCLQYSFIYFIQ